MYSEAGDMSGLAQSLLFAFKESARVKGPENVQLREVLTARGAGFTYTSAYKVCILMCWFACLFFCTCDPTMQFAARPSLVYILLPTETAQTRNRYPAACLA